MSNLSTLGCPDESTGVERGPILMGEVARAIILIKAGNRKFSAGKFRHLINQETAVPPPPVPAARRAPLELPWHRR